MAIAQRPVIGLKDVKYALLTESSDVVGGTPTWGTLYSLSNAIELSFDRGSSAATLFADDGPAFTAETIGEMNVSFNIADILPEHVARLLGHTYSNGQIVENSSDQSPYIALGGKILRSGTESGNAVYEYFWLYKLRLTKPAANAKTKGATIEYQTPSMEGRVVQLTSTGNYRTRMRTDDENANATTLANFFNQVTLPSADVNALSVAIAEGTAGNAGKIEFAFSKTGGGNFILNASTVTTSNIVVGTSSGIRAGSLSTPSTTPAATQVIYFTPTVAFSSTNDVAATVTPNVKDNNNVACTLNTDVITIA